MRYGRWQISTSMIHANMDRNILQNDSSNVWIYVMKIFSLKAKSNSSGPSGDIFGFLFIYLFSMFG